MKTISILLALFISVNAFSQNSGEEIIGKWLKIPKEDMIIEVYQSNNEFKAKIDWSIDTIKKPIGFNLLENMEYNAADNTWENGRISDPNSGSTYSAVAKVLPDGTLEVHAYKGVKVFGTKKYFRRAK